MKKLLITRANFKVICSSPNEYFFFDKDGVSFKLKAQTADEAHRLCAALITGLPVSNDLSESFELHGFSLQSLQASQALLKHGALEIIDNLPDFTDRLNQEFRREIEYFSDTASIGTSGTACFERVRQSSILMIGMGSLGSWVFQHLCANGVGKIVVVDGDEVELSNLPRQTLFDHQHLAKSKVYSAAEIATRQFPHTTVTPIHQFVESIKHINYLIAKYGKFDLMVLTADSPRWEIARWAASAAKITGTPLIRGTSQGIGPLYLPGESACPYCEWAWFHEKEPNAQRIAMLTAQLPRRSTGALSTIVSMSGALLAMQSLTYLSGVSLPETIDHQLMIKPGGLGISKVLYSKHELCMACAEPYTESVDG
ncbi:HesA/MoeB/ThiF family protein [Chitinimonas sp. PSY-7]|uniref:ThiF family adenylyltransferase n=1 Tax=Chitinimonas sp. PSY-7 TaxID=3459088 RepID=UPI004040129D